MTQPPGRLPPPLLASPPPLAGLMPHGLPPPLSSTGVAKAATAGLFAWWGVFPVLVFGVLHLLVGWRTAQLRASAPEYAVSYVAGGLVGGLVLAGLGGWIAYYICGRSRTASTLTLTAILVLFSMGDLRLAKRATSVIRNAADAPALATFGSFEFEVPAGWSQVSPPDGKTKAMLCLNSTDPSRADGVIMVDVGKPARPTAGEMAQLMAGEDGQVMPSPVFLDGVEGLRVETSSRDLSRPRSCVVIIRDGQLYLVMVAGSREADVSTPFRHVLTTWRWTAPDR